MSKNPIIGTFHDAETGETITRELTPEEIAQLPTEPMKETDAEQPNSIGVFDIAYRLRRP